MIKTLSCLLYIYFLFQKCYYFTQYIGGVPYPGVKGRDLYRLLKTDYRLEKPAHITQEM